MPHAIYHFFYLLNYYCNWDAILLLQDTYYLPIKNSVTCILLMIFPVSNCQVRENTSSQCAKKTFSVLSCFKLILCNFPGSGILFCLPSSPQHLAPCIEHNRGSTYLLTFCSCIKFKVHGKWLFFKKTGKRCEKAKVCRDEKIAGSTMGMWEGSPAHSQATFPAGGQGGRAYKQSHLEFLGS